MARPSIAFLAATLLAVGGGLAPADADAVAAVPDEAGVALLPVEPVLQSVAGDVDGDGRRELVRLVQDAANGTLVAVWREGQAGWESAGTPAELLPPAERGVRGDRVFANAPVRLLVWHDGTRERVLAASQPLFELLDAGPACCLLLHDVAVTDRTVHLMRVATPSNAVDALLMLDLDGDGADELLATRSARPRSGVSLPLEARRYRWAGDTFTVAEETTLPSGAGEAPFVLGDTDGRPGQEAGVVATLGPTSLVRIALDGAGALALERSELTAAVTMVRADRQRPGGAIVVSAGDDLELLTWPSGEQPVEIASTRLVGHQLRAVVDTPNGPAAVVEQPALDRLHLLDLHSLAPAPGTPLASGEAARTLERTPARAYAGPLPGGAPDGGEAVIAGGLLLPDRVRTATLAGAVPIGLVGDGSWLAIEHAAVTLPPLAPEGGRFEVPSPVPGAWQSIVPLTEALAPELGGGLLQAQTAGLRDLSERGIMLGGPNGFTVRVAAPPGSRVLATGRDPSEPEGRRARVPTAGVVEVTMRPPPGSPPNPRYRPLLLVLTPAGHGYVARWEVQLLTAPPSLEAEAAATFLSPEVAIGGRTSPFANVVVAGSPTPVGADGRFSTSVSLPPWPSLVRVEVVDLAGNRASTALTAAGFVDYRGVPWFPMVVTLTAAAALYVRGPGQRERAMQDEEGAELIELEPD